MAHGYSHCGTGFISIVVISISPAISASHGFRCVLLMITHYSSGETVLVWQEPIIYVGNRVGRAGEARTENPLTSGLKLQRSKILRVPQETLLWDMLSGIPSALLIVILIIRAVTFIEGSLCVPGIVLSAFHTLCQLILTTTSWASCCSFLQFYGRGKRGTGKWSNISELQGRQAVKPGSEGRENSPASALKLDSVLYASLKMYRCTPFSFWKWVPPYGVQSCGVVPQRGQWGLGKAFLWP